MSQNAAYAATPRAAAISISTANTNRDGTGTITTLITAGANGSRVDDITIMATGTTTAGMVRFFLINAGVNRLVKEVPVSAVTPSGSVGAFAFYLQNLRVILPSGWSIGVSTHNAETFHVGVTRGGDF